MKRLANKVEREKPATAALPEFSMRIMAAHGRPFSPRIVDGIKRGCKWFAKLSDEELRNAAYPYFHNPHAKPHSASDIPIIAKGLMEFALTGCNDMPELVDGKTRLVKVQQTPYQSDTLMKAYGLPTWDELRKDASDDSDDEEDDSSDDDSSDSSDDSGDDSSYSDGHYNPDEPRILAGQPGGGQWTTGDGTVSDPSSISADDIRNDPSDTVTQIGSIEPMAYTTTQIVSDNKDINTITSEIQTSNHGFFTPVGTVLDANGNPVNQVNVFVGGFGDGGNPLVGSSKVLQEAIGSNYYFSWQQGTAIDDFIRSLPPDTTINLIGHSYGGDTAAQVAADNPGYVQTLITIDPVSRFNFTSYSTINQRVGTWIDVNATPNPQEPKTGGDIAAAAGGAWNSGPSGKADIYIEATQHHEGFTNMMNTATSNGKTPLQILNSGH